MLKQIWTSRPVNSCSNRPFPISDQLNRHMIHMSLNWSMLQQLSILTCGSKMCDPAFKSEMQCSLSYMSMLMIQPWHLTEICKRQNHVFRSHSCPCHYPLVHHYSHCHISVPPPQLFTQPHHHASRQDLLYWFAWCRLSFGSISEGRIRRLDTRRKTSNQFKVRCQALDISPCWVALKFEGFLHAPRTNIL